MNTGKENIIDILFDDDVKEKSINMLIRLEPTYFYTHMKENPNDMEVLLLAKMLHTGQVDKSGNDYMVHLIHSADIALRIKNDFSIKHNIENIDDSSLVKILLLHDSLEDDKPRENAEKFGKTVKELFLEYNISDVVIDAIKDMTREDGERYSDFISRIHEKNNPYSIIGKISDIMSNNHPERAIDKVKTSLVKRYNKALKLLGGSEYIVGNNMSKEKTLAI